MYNPRRLIFSAIAVLCCFPLLADTGAPNYTYGAQALYKAFIAIEVYMTYAYGLCSAIAGIVVVISALQIYFKMNHGEDGVQKSIQMLFWSVIFLIASAIIFPAFFGFTTLGV